MKKVLSVLFAFSILAVGCTPAFTPAPTVTASPEPRTLTVFADSALTEAFTEVGAQFEAANPGVTVKFRFGGTQTLRNQIIQSGGADVFASASVREMTVLVAALMVDKNAAQRAFATDKLVVVLPTGNPANIQSIDGLAAPGLKLSLPAETDPAGKYTRIMLKNLNATYGDGFNQKVIGNAAFSEENVRLVVDRVKSGEADAGIVYFSDLITAPSLVTLPIPDEANTLAEFTIAALTQSPNTDLAQKFVDFIFSSDGQNILLSWKFGAAR
jgi:molybdate transport system substrate-binding protein